MKKRVLIVGSGWYGLHVARTLKSNGHNVVVIDSSSSIMSGAASRNQLRLHQGFHYLRSFRTRSQAQIGFKIFMKEYEFLTKEVRHNMYAASATQSHLDMGTIRQIMSGQGMSFVESNVEQASFIEGVEGLWTCDERIISPDASATFFTAYLRDDLRLQTSLQWKGSFENTFENYDRDFDYFIDASYGGLSPLKGVIYEATLIAGFSANALPFGALTLVDGPLFSIFPTEKEFFFSFSHVQHSVLGQFDSRVALNEFLQQNNSLLIEARVGLMREHARAYLPTLQSELDGLAPYFVQRKVKPVGLSDGREVRVSTYGRHASILGGKIDAVFAASEEITDWIS